MPWPSTRSCGGLQMCMAHTINAKELEKLLQECWFREAKEDALN